MEKKINVNQSCNCQVGKSLTLLITIIKKDGLLYQFGALPHSSTVLESLNKDFAFAYELDYWWSMRTLQSGHNSS